MKFVHIADMHFDSSFRTLSDRGNLGNIRRLEQRKIFREIINYVKENNIQYLFIAGDLYEHEYIRQTTIEYINNLFKTIPKTKIYITPGNHDPFLKNSYYSTFNWNENVKIFNKEIEKIENSECTIYGFGFNDFYCTDAKIDEIELDKNKLNILIMHSSIDGASIEEKQYNSVPNRILKEKGFDYVATGHIHKLDMDVKNKKYVYPGSTMSFGFDEQGKHGMIVGDISKENINLEFIVLDKKEFVEENLDISNIFSEEELLEKLNEINTVENKLYKINLVGNRNIEINKYKLLKLINNDNIIKIKDKTKLNLNLESIVNETTLRGLFVKEMLKKFDGQGNSEMLEKALEIGLEVLGDR